MGEESFQSEAKERCSLLHLNLSSVPHKQTMLIKTVFDIQTKQPVYAVCETKTERCGFVTYSITKAIQAAQCKDFNQLQTLINA